MSYWTYGGDAPRFVITTVSGLAAGDESVLIRELRRIAKDARDLVIPKLPPRTHVYIKKHGEAALRSCDVGTIATNLEEGYFITSLYEYMTGAKVYEIEWELKPDRSIGW